MFFMVLCILYIFTHFIDYIIWSQFLFLQLKTDCLPLLLYGFKNVLNISLMFQTTIIYKIKMLHFWAEPTATADSQTCVFTGYNAKVRKANASFVVHCWQSMLHRHAAQSGCVFSVLPGHHNTSTGSFLGAECFLSNH